MNYCPDVVQSFVVTRGSDGSNTPVIHYCEGKVNVKYNYSLGPGSELAPATTICLAFGGVSKTLAEGTKVGGDLFTYTVRFVDSEIESQADLFYSMIKFLRGNSSMGHEGPSGISWEEIKAVNGQVTQFFDVKRTTSAREITDPATVGDNTEQGEQPDLSYLMKPASYWIKVNNNEKSEWINVSLGSPITLSDMTDEYLAANPDMKKFSKEVFNIGKDAASNSLSIKHDSLQSQKLRIVIKWKEYKNASVS